MFRGPETALPCLPLSACRQQPARLEQPRTYSILTARSPIAPVLDGDKGDYAACVLLLIAAQAGYWKLMASPERRADTVLFPRV